MQSGVRAFVEKRAGCVRGVRDVWWRGGGGGVLDRYSSLRPAAKEDNLSERARRGDRWAGIRGRGQSRSAAVGLLGGGVNGFPASRCGGCHSR